MTDMELLDRLCEKAGFWRSFDKLDDGKIRLTVKAGDPMDGEVFDFRSIPYGSEDECLSAFFGLALTDGSWFVGKAAPFRASSRPELELKLNV